MERSARYLSELNSKMGSRDLHDSIYYHTGIVGRGLEILKNYYHDDPVKFMTSIIHEDLRKSIYAMCLCFKQNGREIKNDFAEYVYRNLADFYFMVSDKRVQTDEIDFVQEIFNTIAIILETIFPPNEDAIIELEFEAYEEIVSSLYSSISKFCDNDMANLESFMQSKENIKSLYEIGKGCYLSETEQGLNCLKAISSLIRSLSKYSTPEEDGLLYQHKVYLLIFEILDKVEDKVIDKYLSEAIDNFMNDRPFFCSELCDVSNLKLLFSVGYDSSKAEVKRHLCKALFNFFVAVDAMEARERSAKRDQYVGNKTVWKM